MILETGNRNNRKLALVTGAAIRVGRYIAKRLAQLGYKIAVIYNNSASEAEELKIELSAITEISIYKVDLTNEIEVLNAINKIENEMGNIDVLINNASIYQNDNLYNSEINDIKNNFNIHVLSPLLLGRTIKSGNIINILDAEIEHQLSKFFSYSLSKKTLHQLTKMMAFNMAPEVRVNSIALGPILFKSGQVREVFENLIVKSPLKKSASMEDLFKTIEFILNVSSITGQCIFLDGGIHLL